MVDEQKKMLIDLEVRIKQLILLCDSLKRENEELKAHDKRTTLQMEALEKEFRQLETKYENLKIARTITAGSVDVSGAKEKLSKLVQEVDRCIALLNN